MKPAIGTQLKHRFPSPGRPRPGLRPIIAAVPDDLFASNAIHISDIEAAIDFWRARAPSPDGVLLAPQVAALAEVYARLVHTGAQQWPEAQWPEAALQAWLAWYDSTPDTPCIAICSTSQGDACCKGCGRSFFEVQHWLSLTPVQKRAVWRRITQQGAALRFTRYAERVLA